VIEPVGRDKDPWTARVVPETKVNVPDVKESEVSERRNWEESRESRRSALRLEPDPWAVAGTVKVMVSVESFGVMVILPEATKSMFPSLLETSSKEERITGFSVTFSQETAPSTVPASKRSTVREEAVIEEAVIVPALRLRKEASPSGVIYHSSSSPKKMVERNLIVPSTLAPPERKKEARGERIELLKEEGETKKKETAERKRTKSRTKDKTTAEKAGWE